MKWILRAALIVLLAPAALGAQAAVECAPAATTRDGLVEVAEAGFRHDAEIDIEPVESAWPQIMLFHGPLLNERAVVAGVSEVERFLESVAPVAIEGFEPGRPAIQVAMYWEPDKWGRCANDPGCLRRLDPSDAEQLAVYYPGFNARLPFFSARGFSGVVGDTGLEMLEERGIPGEVGSGAPGGWVFYPLSFATLRLSATAPIMRR